MLSPVGRVIGYLFAGLILGAGPFILFLDAVTGVQRALFVHSSLSADGVVIGFRDIRSRRSSTKYSAPAFRFTTRDSRSVTVVSDIYASRPPWRPGDRVRILYQPDHPEDAHIDSFLQLWEPQLVMGIVGSAFSTIPLLIFLRGRGRRTKTAAALPAL
jgi:hypothetical protein